MLPLLASTEQLGRRIPGGLADRSAEMGRAEEALRDASAVVRAEAEDVWIASGATSTAPSWVTGAGPVPDLIVAVVCNVAKRVVVNPEAVKSIDYGDGRGRDFEEPTTDIFLKKSEREQIARCLRPPRAARCRTGEIAAPDPLIPSAATTWAAEKHGLVDPYR